MFSEISKDLKNESIEDICTKYNITFKELVEQSLQNNPRTNGDKNTYRFIYPRDNHYVIMKTIKREYRYFGTYSSLEDARKVRDKLIDCNWEKSQLSSILEELGVKNNGNSE